MSRWRAGLAAVTAVLLALPAVTAVLAVPATPAVADDTTRCTLSDPRITESSGLAASTWRDDRFWTHNDSGDKARIFAIDNSCRVTAVLNLAGIDAFDAEDLASGPDHTLWLADIGDNIAQRQRIVLDVVHEPESVSGEQSVPATRYRFSYPDGAHDAEALLVHPRSGQVLVVTKAFNGGKPMVYAAPAHLQAGSVMRLTFVARLDVPGLGGGFDAVTGGAVSPDGHTVVLRTYSGAFAWSVSGDDLTAAFRSTPKKIELPLQPQGESIAFSRDGRTLLATSEGQDTALIQVPVGSDGTPSSAPHGSSRSAMAGLWLAVLVVVVLALAALTVRVRGRRR